MTTNTNGNVNQSHELLFNEAPVSIRLEREVFAQVGGIAAVAHSVAQELQPLLAAMVSKQISMTPARSMCEMIRLRMRLSTGRASTSTRMGLRWLRGTSSICLPGAAAG